MTPDMADAHETARERDAKAKADARHARFMAAIDRILARDPQTAQARDAAWTLGALDGGSPRTRTHHIDTETGEFTLLDNQEDTMDAPNEVKIHVTIDREQVREAARLAAELFITEYASRLVEAVDPNYLDDEPVEDCGRPPRVHVNPERTDWLDEPIPVPRPEPADITEEPPVGSQVTDMSGDVWERREGWWALWWPERSGWIADPYGGEVDPWPVARTHAPLRPTTDADRERVGLPLRPGTCDGCGNPIPVARCVCATCDHDNSTKPAPADVDPDEALAKVLLRVYCEDDRAEFVRLPARDQWERVARAAREHIEAEDAAAHPVGCGQMIRDVRDGNGFSTQIDGVLIAKCDTYGRTKSESVANARADKALADLARVTEERDEAVQVSRRHVQALGRLRSYYADYPAESINPAWVARRIQRHMDEIDLARDTERAES